MYMNLVFSAGWLYLFIFIMILCVWRLVAKASIVNREGRSDARVLHIEPFTPEKRTVPASGALGVDSQAMDKAEEALTATLRQLPDTDLEGRAGVLVNLGRLYRDRAAVVERRGSLIEAARAYYQGTQLGLPEGSAVRFALFAGLGDAYLELSSVYETRECLVRAMQAYATALKNGGADPENFAALCEKYSEAALSLAGHSEPELNRRRAAQALKAGLGRVDEQGHADWHRRLREKLVEVELGGENPGS